MRELIERYLAAYNRIDVDSMMATVHSEVVFENWTGGTLALRVNGAHELRHLAESSRHLFSARRQTLVAYSQQADTASIHVLFEGTFAINLPNGIRAGQTIAMRGRSEFRQRDGLLVHIADYSD